MSDAVTQLTHISSTEVNLTASFCSGDENLISAAHRKNASRASLRHSLRVASTRRVRSNCKFAVLLITIPKKRMVPLGHHSFLVSPRLNFLVSKWNRPCLRGVRRL